MPVGGFERGPQDLRAKEFGHAAWLGGKGVEQKMNKGYRQLQWEGSVARAEKINDFQSWYDSWPKRGKLHHERPLVLREL